MPSLAAAHLALAQGPAEKRARDGTTRPLLVASSRPSASASAASSYAPLVVPVPPLAAEREYRDRTEYTDWYTGHAAARTPVVRVAPGAVFRTAGPGKHAFALDLLVGARLGLTPGNNQWGVFPEIGYGWNRANHEHQLTAGIGVGRGNLAYWGYVAVMPRLVVHPGVGVGGRLGLVGQITETGLSAEIAVQQIARPSGERLSDLRLSLGIDLFLLGSVVSGSRAWREWARP